MNNRIMNAPWPVRGNSLLEGRPDRAEQCIPFRIRGKYLERDIDRAVETVKRENKREIKEAQEKFKTSRAKAQQLLAENEKAMLNRYEAKFSRKKVKKLLEEKAKWNPKWLIAFIEAFKRERQAGIRRAA